MTAKRKRLDVLEAQHARRQATGPHRDTLAGAALALAHTLPDRERQTVEALGARGHADLLEASWAVTGDDGADPRPLARRAYALAFGGTP